MEEEGLPVGPPLHAHHLPSFPHTGASTSSGGLCRLVTSSGDCRITAQCFALPDRLAQLLDTHPYEVRALVSELAQDAGSALVGSTGQGAGEGGDAEDAPAEVEKEEGGEHGLSSMRALSRISQDGGPAGGSAEGRRPFREQVEEAMMLAAGGEEAATGGPAAGVSDAGVVAAGAGAPQRLALGSVLAFGPRNVGPNVLCLPPSFRLRVLWSAGDDAEKGGAVEKPTEVALVDASAAMAWMRSVAWPSLRNSLAVGFQMATASGASSCLHG